MMKQENNLNITISSSMVKCKEIWGCYTINELGNIVRGLQEMVKGTNVIQLVTSEGKQLSHDRKVTNTHILHKIISWKEKSNQHRAHDLGKRINNKVLPTDHCLRPNNKNGIEKIFWNSPRQP